MLPSSWLHERNKTACTTLAATSRAIGERTGIIKHLSDRTIEPDDPRLFHAVTSVTNTSRLYQNAGPTGNSGAGLTRELAMASAIGETLERYCCAIYDARDLVVSSYADLQRQGMTAVAPHALALYADSQYQRPDFILRRFTEDREISWVPGFSLIHKKVVLVPACLVYVPYKYEHPGDLIAFGVTTGLCCAHSPSEAILGGLYEVVERDAIMIMWMNRLPCPRIIIPPDSCLSVVLQERFIPSGLRFSLNDITTDLPVPVVFAFLIDEHNEGLAIVAGASANMNPEAAALKALIEAAQGRRWLKLMKRNNASPRYRKDFSDVVNFDDHVALFASLSSIPYIDFLVTSPAERDLFAVNSCITADREQSLNKCLEAFAAKDLDVIVVNVTQPDVEELGFSVVKVLVPGLVDINADHNYPLLGGKRLYTVPWILGFTDHEVQENELNPIPHPFP